MKAGVFSNKADRFANEL